MRSTAHLFAVRVGDDGMRSKCEALGLQREMVGHLPAACRYFFTTRETWLMTRPNCRSLLDLRDRLEMHAWAEYRLR